MTKHESSNNHLSACLICNKWKSDQVLDTDLDKTLKFKTNYWIKVLERVINVTLTLAKNNVSFRGDNESLYDGDHNRGNFLNIIELLSIYDPVLKELLSKDKKCVKYLSPTIQNEIINLLANEVKTELISQINESPFFSVIMDTTQDISKIDQVSFVVRYADFIKDNDNVIRDVVIREVFLGFEKCMGQSAEDMVKQLLLFFEKNNLSFERLRTQGYDGAANMTGVYNGLQAKILEKQPNALYVYCAAHNLNLVINDSVKISRELQNFYDFVESLYAFFAHSIKRWAVLTEMFDLKKHIKTIVPNAMVVSL
ncbi:zinc finger MYM-type protein 1-like [Sitophilus oryzae]|uniref:Zinc finger MYM-type protein 1-like n=1 Tax=Sitophilus oryzae TaxID=7048 RepID=A0A6J2Y7K1_SITOR|nr:zinc finger MYM-type protein 1-like [Sitophilus oryzae]